MVFSLDYYVLVGSSGNPTHGAIYTEKKFPLTTFFIPSFRDFEPQGVKLTISFNLGGVSVNSNVMNLVEINSVLVRSEGAR